MRDAALDLLKVIGVENSTVVQKARQKAAVIAGSPHQPEDKRVEAIRFLALGNPAPYAGLLKKLISPAEQSSIQVAALQALSAIPGDGVSQYLLAKWSVLTPEIRNEAINTFMVNSDRISVLLDAIEAGKIQNSDIGWPRSVRLMAQRDLKLRERARVLLTKDESERAKVNKEYQDALTLKGNNENGKNIFFKNCSGCHQIRGNPGVEFGPDLGTIHNWSPDAIMANILAPNLSISSGFDLWSIELKDGGTFQGIISTETPTAITVKNAGNENKNFQAVRNQIFKSAKYVFYACWFRKANQPPGNGRFNRLP